MPKIKVIQLGVSSNIFQNYKSSIQEHISGHYFTQFISKVDQKLNQIKLESVRTVLKITPLTSRKSHLVIIDPNSYEKLTKIKN